MIGILLKRDFKENLKTWLGCLLGVVLLFVAMYFSSTLLNNQGSLILSQSYVMFVNLIPLIYLILAGANLIVRKIDDGSFYFEMVSRYKRRNILLTKMVYYVCSLAVIYLFLVIAGILCFAIKPVSYLDWSSLLLMNLMSFLLNLSLGSIIFFASCFFNSSKNALLAGAGIPLLSYAFNTISSLFINIPGREDNALINMLFKLKYISFHSLFSYDDIIAGSSFNYIGIGVFIAVSIVFFCLSFLIFDRKDLPL